LAVKQSVRTSYCFGWPTADEWSVSGHDQSWVHMVTDNASILVCHNLTILQWVRYHWYTDYCIIFSIIWKKCIL